MSVVREPRVRARHVRVVVARLPRRPRVPPRQRPALAHQNVVVASMSLHPNNHTRYTNYLCSPHSFIHGFDSGYINYCKWVHTKKFPNENSKCTIVMSFLGLLISTIENILFNKSISKTSLTTLVHFAKLKAPEASRPDLSFFFYIRYTDRISCF